jgi:hypothetical protein
MLSIGILCPLLLMRGLQVMGLVILLIRSLQVIISSLKVMGLCLYRPHRVDY